MSEVSHRLPMQWMSLHDVLGKTISYAQNYEDILLARVFPGREGFYLDIGANHPVFHSVTKLFYERGWRGINIEPTPALFEQLVHDRPEDMNLNIGVGSSEGILPFYEATGCHGWSTFRPELAEHYRSQGVAITERSVSVLTLSQVCERYVDRTIDFLKIDAEGFEREILLGADFSKWRPRVLVIENAWPEAWESLLEGIDYKLAAFDGLNRFYVRLEDENLLGSFVTIANALDNFVPYEIVRLLREKRSIIDQLTHGVRLVVRKIRAKKLRRVRPAS